MGQIKVCPACKLKNSTLTFYFEASLKQTGSITINKAGEPIFEAFSSTTTVRELMPFTPVICSCGWAGKVMNLITEADHYGNDR